MTKSKANIFILLTVVVSFLFSSIFLTNKQSLEFNEKNQIQINQSGFWDLTGAPIYIDDSATGVGAHNWTWAVSQPWCSGSGSWADHYVIEDVTIKGQSSDNCIEIKNSDAYFIIRNCLLSNSGPYTDGCLVLDNVNNGKIKNNTCSDNPRSGIRLVYSHNNTISGNTASNNNNGLYLVHSHNNTLSGNTVIKDPMVFNNGLHGITLSNSNNNNLSGNLMYFCGITLTGSLGGMVSHNIDNTNLVNNEPIYYYVNDLNLGLGNFTDAGQIILINCSNSIISGLNLSNITTGIFLGYSNNNTLSGNTVNNNYYGMHLFESGNNTLSGNTASNNYRGILLGYSHNNTLLGNTASNNNYDGIRLYYSGNNTLSGNTASNNNYYGIRLSSSYYNILSGNIASSNIYDGILLSNSNNNDLSGNLMYFCGISLFGSLVEITSHSIDNTNLVHNKPVYYYVNELSLGSSNFTDAGQIILINCNKSIISGLDLSNGSTGIQLVYCNNNNVSGNAVNNNNYDGIHLNESGNNTLSGNIVSNNHCGISLSNCDDNTLSENTASNNYRGIHLGESNNNKLSGNIVNNNHDGMFLTHSNNNNIFLNYFNNNEFNAADNGINNKWDNGTIGNYWDDYTFIDENRDGIGDRPYIIPGSARSQDNFPIWPDIDEELDDELIISFGNYYILFMLITILSFILLEKQKKKLKN